jgi:hypothetical protein
MLRENSHVESKNLSTKIKFYFETNKTLDRRVQIYKEALKQGLPGGRAGWLVPLNFAGVKNQDAYVKIVSFHSVHDKHTMNIRDYQ